MATPLELSTGSGADGIPVVSAVGEIDMSNAEVFRAVLDISGLSGIASVREG
jgi:hypothetical protein